MTKKKSPLPLSIPGGALAPAWLNAWLATSDDDSRPILYRTMLVEVYKTGVQLVSTDSFMLLTSFAPTIVDDLVPPPSLDEAPVASYIVQDTDRRAIALMRYVLAEAKSAEKEARPFDVTLSVATVEDPSVPTLDPTLDRSGFVIATDSERLALPIYQGDYPNWRNLIAQAKTNATEHIALSPMLLGRLGKLKGTPTPIRMDFDGDLGMVRLSASGHESYLSGGLMPIREAS